MTTSDADQPVGVMEAGRQLGIARLALGKVEVAEEQHMLAAIKQRRDPLAHAKIFFKDLAHLMGIARA